jgi:hypothetical protein
VDYLIGVILGLSVASFATVVGFDRDRSFYSTVAIVNASYYALFAVMGGSGRTIGIESMVVLGFSIVAAIGFKRNPWLVCAAVAGHGAFDLVHHVFIENAGVPSWWPGFCLAFDVTAGAWFAGVLLMRSSRGSGDAMTLQLAPTISQ